MSNAFMFLGGALFLIGVNVRLVIWLVVWVALLQHFNRSKQFLAGVYATGF